MLYSLVKSINSTGPLKCAKAGFNCTAFIFSGYLPYEMQQATLHLAAAYGDVREMQTLLRQFQTQNKNVDERTKDGMTPLLLAAQNGHLGDD